jgi:galactose oxidase-like protein/Kelch motif protein
VIRLALVLVLAACASAGPSKVTEGPPLAATTAPATTATTPGSGALAWRRIADIPTPRSEVAAAVFRNVAFVVGGFGGANVAETFASGRWSAAPAYPLAVDHAMAAGVDTQGTPGLYVFGGNLSGTPTARSFRWFGDEGWREIAAMPGPRAQGAAVALGDRIYVVGGAAGDRLVAPTYVYDTTNGRWSQRASIPTPRDHLAGASLDGRACAVGGRRLSMLQNLATFECYDPVADVWAKLPDAPTARGGVGAAVIGSRLYFVGGEQPAGTFKQVEIYDSVAGAWSKGPDLPNARHGLGVVAVGSTLLVLSGGPTPGGSQTPICEALDVG